MAKNAAKKTLERKAKPVKDVYDPHGEPWPDIGIKPEIELYPHDEAHLYVTEGRYTGVKKETLEKAKADYKKEVDSLRANFRNAEFNPEKIPGAIQTFKKIKNRYSIKLNKFKNPNNAVRLLPGFYNLQCDVYKELLQKIDYYIKKLEAAHGVSHNEQKTWGNVNGLDSVFRLYPQFEKDIPLLIKNKYVRIENNCIIWCKSNKSLSEYFGNQNNKKTKWEDIGYLFNKETSVLKSLFIQGKKKMSKHYEELQRLLAGK